MKSTEASDPAGGHEPTDDDAGAAAHRAPESAFFRRSTEWVLRHRWTVLALNLLIFVGMAYAAATRWRMDVSAEPFLPKDSDTRLLNDAFADDFGHDVFTMLLIEGDVFSMGYLERLRALHRDLEDLYVEIPSLGQRPNRSTAPRDVFADSGDDFGGFGEDGWGDEEGGAIFERVSSLINARQTLGVEDGVVVEGLLDTWPSEAALPALRKRVMADRSMVGRLVGKAGTHSAVVLNTDYMRDEDTVLLYRALRELTAKHEAQGFKIHIAGMPALIASLTELNLQDLKFLFVAAMLMMAVILLVVFRHPLGVVGPVAAVVQATVWALGTTMLLDKPFTQASGIIPAFLICVGIGDAVHIQSAYRDQRRAGVKGNEAIVRAVSTTGTAVLFTTITTFVGLISFQFAEAEAIKDIGLLGAFGVLVAMVQCLVVVPIFLTFHKRGSFGARDPSRDGHGPLDSFLSACSRVSRPRIVDGNRLVGRPATVLAGALIFTAVSLYGASTIYVSHDDIIHMPEDTPAKIAVGEANKHLGGTGELSIYIRAHEGKTLADRELMLGLAKLEEHILAYREAGTGNSVSPTVFGILDVLRETNRALNQGNQAFYRVPDTQRGVVDMFTLFQNSGPDELRQIATVDLKRGMLKVRSEWMDARRCEPMIQYIQAGIDKYISDRADVRITGTGHLFVEVMNMSLRDLLRSFAIAFAAITLLMTVLLGGIKLGAIAMVPNLVPIAAVMGVMGFGGIWLDYSNVLVASIALGIVVDDTIHFLHQFRAQYEATGSVESGLKHAFDHSGRAIIITSLVLFLGFSVFALAQMGNAALFGILTATTVTFAVFVDLVLTPALLRLFLRDREAVSHSEPRESLPPPGLQSPAQ